MSIVELIKRILSRKTEAASTEGAPDTSESASSQERVNSFNRWYDKVSKEKRLARQVHDQQLKDDLRDEEANRQRAKEFKLRCPKCSSTDVDLAYEGRFKCRKCNTVFS